MHPRLRWLVKIDRRARALWAFVTRTSYKWPLYTRPMMSAEERALERESVRNFIGGRSPNPVVARYYREHSRLALLASDNVSAARKSCARRVRCAAPRTKPRCWLTGPRKLGHGSPERADRPERWAAPLQAQRSAVTPLCRLGCTTLSASSACESPSLPRWGPDRPPVEAHVALAPGARLGPVSRLTSNRQFGRRSSCAGDRRLP